MNNWKPISKFVTFSTKGITPQYVESSSIIVLNQKCIRNNRIDHSFSQYTDDTKKIQKTKFVQLGDILVNSTGAGTAGRCAFVKELPKNHRLIVDSHILILRCKSYYDALCINYSLFYFESKLMSFMIGSSGQSELDKVVLLDLKINIPSEPSVQKKNTAVLSCLDSKIVLDELINTELKAIAKTLFNYWFVQFDFPDTKGRPYKASGGKMVWNEDLKREIPDGWVAKPLSEITDVSNQSINPFNYPNKEFKHYSIPTYDETGTYGIEKGAEIKSNKFVISSNDILVSKLNPWFNRVIYSTDDKDLISSTEFVVWRARTNEIKNYLFTVATDASFISYCTKSATGTSNSHKRVNPTVMMKYRVAYKKEIAELFGAKVEATIKMYAKNQLENKNLLELRNWLLPMLMNGQVKVN